jgi:hypothetical protein
MSPTIAHGLVRGSAQKNIRLDFQIARGGGGDVLRGPIWKTWLNFDERAKRQRGQVLRALRGRWEGLGE